MRRINHKLWIGIGVATVAIGGPFASARADQPEKSKPASTGTAAGRGGETYLSDGGPSDTRVRYIRDMILFQGQVMICDELVAAGQWSDAQGHLIEQTAELRAALLPYMQRHGVVPFAADLAALADAMDEQDVDAYRRARSAFELNRISSTDLVKRFSTPYHRFALRAVVEAAKAASSSYEAAFLNDARPQAAEYREGRGYVAAARRRLAEISPELSLLPASKVKDIEQEFERLARAWPTLVPPDHPIIPAIEIAEHVARIAELAAAF